MLLCTPLKDATGNCSSHRRQFLVSALPGARKLKYRHMSRLTPKQYLRTHRQLRRFWLSDDRLYAELTPLEQWQLHDYFQPSKNLTDEELLAHREHITKERPSLPQQAGRALSKFQAWAAQLGLARVRRAKAPIAMGGRRGGKRRDRHLTVKAVVRPEIDLDKLARALLAVAKDQVAARRREMGRVALTGLVVATYEPTTRRLSGDIEFILRYPRFSF